MEYKYELIRSSRKTICAEIKLECGLIVRAPYSATQKDIDRFLSENSAFIEKHLSKLEKSERAAESLGHLTAEELQALADEALEYIPQRVKYYSGIIGVKVTRVTIRNQKTKWGSATSQGHLNFNCLLMLAPKEVADSVIVHELCHLKYMNHSEKFYSEVYKYFPEYDKWNKWLKENGGILLKRMI